MSLNLDLIVRNGTVVTATDCARCDVGIRDGKIAVLADRLDVQCPVIDASGRVLFDPRMDDLRARLSALLAACKAGGGDPLEPTTAAAIKSVEDAVSDALDCGCEVALVRSTLDDWTKATGGPRITITGERPPAR